MDTPNVSCSVCHDPHSAENPQGLRVESAGKICETCHYEKWQNAIIEGISGEIGNGYHYPGEDYSFFLADGNPHHTEKKCVLCHMSRLDAVFDENGVRKIGGHTFRMRDFGPDNVSGTNDDTLIIKVCRDCHEGLETFDLNGFQTEIKGLMNRLFSLLKENNHGFLPANQPGKCARCHKGGTVPFLDDPDGILERAYINYKLFVNDRSLGMHNPGYIKKLLQDSIDDITKNYKPSDKE
jgi:predicted CXXCH cytochrome family protein